MMSEPTKVDGLAKDELTGKLVLLIQEKRPWQETNLMHRQLATKVKNYVRHIRSSQFHKKHGKRPKDTIVRLVTAERPGEKTVELLERIGYELQKFKIEFEYEVLSESILGPTPVKPSTPPRPAKPTPEAPGSGPQGPPASTTQPPSTRPEPQPDRSPAEQQQRQPPPGQPAPPQPTQPPPAQSPDRPAAHRPDRPPGPPERQPPEEGPPTSPAPEPPRVQQPETEVEQPGPEGPSETPAADPFLEYLQAEQEREGVGAQGGAEPEAHAQPPVPEVEPAPGGGPPPAAEVPAAEGGDGPKKPEIFPEEEFGRLTEYEGDEDQLIVESSSGKRTSLGRPGDTEHAPPPFTTYAEQVAAEKPSIWRGLLAGLTGAISGSILWALMAAGVGHGVSPVAIAVGFMVGWSIRVRVRGHTLTYRIIAIIFTILGTLLGTGLAAATVVALREGLGFSGIIAKLSDQSALLTAVGQVYNWVDLLAYVIAIYLAFRISTTSEAAEEPGVL